MHAFSGSAAAAVVRRARARPCARGRGPARQATSALAIGLVALACSAPPGAVPSGERVKLRIVDREAVLLDGQRMSWDELDRRMRAWVEESRARRRAPPWVVIEIDPDLTERLGPKGDSEPVNRLLELLEEAGVRSVDIGRPRRP